VGHVSSSLLLSAFLIVCGHGAFAQSAACPDRDQASLDALAEQNPQAYEEYRKCRVSQAKDEAELLQWATPDDLADAAGLGPLEGLTSQTSAGGYTVEIHVDLKAGIVRMISPAGAISGSALGTGWRRGYSVPHGCFQVLKTDRHHVSGSYPKPHGGAPMPNAVYFTRLTALHYGSLTTPSHGCVHLDWETSVQVIDTVEKYGIENSEICVE